LGASVVVNSGCFGSSPRKNDIPEQWRPTP
jgi:hypothetical protein